jgi:uncharacterized protein YegL
MEAPVGIELEPEEDFEVRPAIIVVDKSGSMEAVMDSVKLRVNDLIERLTEDDAVSETLALGVIEFDSDSVVRRPLTYFDGATHFHFETRRYKTDFGKALDTCRRMLAEDLPLLANRGYRPAIFFISDGGHNVAAFDVARRSLMALRLAPKIVIFEVLTADSDRQALAGLATDPRLYAPVDATDAAIKDIVERIFGTLGGYASGGDIADAFLDGEIDDDGTQRTYPLD